MDLDSFLAAPKWDVLKIISNRPSSPIEIAEVTQTTVSYVSQQLKLLEAFGIVVKTKTGAFEKGKPRNVYSISEEFAYITVLSDNFSEKKKISLTEHNKIVLRIWMIDNALFHIPLETFFLLIDGHLPNVVAIYLNLLKPHIELVVILSDESAKSKILSSSKKVDTPLKISFISQKDLGKNDLGSLHTLFDPQLLLKKEQELLKGGIE